MNNQVNIYSKFIDNCQKILSQHNNFIIMGNDNIDSMNNHNLSHNYNNFELKDIRDQFLVNNNVM